MKIAEANLLAYGSNVGHNTKTSKARLGVMRPAFKGIGVKFHIAIPGSNCNGGSPSRSEQPIPVRNNADFPVAAPGNNHPYAVLRTATVQEFEVFLVTVAE